MTATLPERPALEVADVYSKRMNLAQLPIAVAAHNV